MSDVFGQVILPLSAAFVALCAMLFAAAKHPRERGVRKPTVAALAGAFATIAGGTALVLGAVGGWCVLADPRSSACVGEALREMTLLAFGVAWPALALLTLVANARRRR